MLFHSNLRVIIQFLLQAQASYPFFVEALMALIEGTASFLYPKETPKMLLY